MKMHQGSESPDDQESHETNSSTDISPPISAEHSSCDCSTKTQCDAPPERLSDEPRRSKSDYLRTKFRDSDTLEYVPHGNESPPGDTPKSHQHHKPSIRDHLNSGRISYCYSEQGRSQVIPHHEPCHDTLAQVGTRGTELPRDRRHSVRAPPLSPHIRSNVVRAVLQTSGAVTTHPRMGREHLGLHMAAEVGLQRLKTNEPVRTRPRKTVRFNSLTIEYGGVSGPEYGKLSPPAPRTPISLRLPMKHMLDKHGDLLQCYQ